MEQLGIEPKLLFAQIVNFTIIVVVLSKLLYKPILSILDKRKKEIEEALAITEKMRKEEEKLASKKESTMTGARQEAQALIEDARKQAKEVEKDLLDKAHKDASDIIAKAKTESARMKEELALDVKRQAVELATSMTKRLLSEALGKREQHDIVRAHLKKLESL